MQKCWLWVALLGFTGSSSAQTADELVAKNIAARGGAAKLHAIDTMTMTATISFGPQHRRRSRCMRCVPTKFARTSLLMGSLRCGPMTERLVGRRSLGRERKN